MAVIPGSPCVISYSKVLVSTKVWLQILPDTRGLLALVLADAMELHEIEWDLGECACVPEPMRL